MAHDILSPPPPDSASEATPARAASRYGRSLAVIALTVPAMLVVDFGVSYGTVAALFSGAVPALLIVVAVGFVMLVGSIVFVSKLLTGRLVIFGAIAVTGLLTWAGAYGFLTGILGPLTLQQGVLLHVVVCAMSALALGLFLGPWPLRIAGAISVVCLITLLTLTPTAAETATIEREKAEAEQLEAARAEWIESGRFPLVTDLPGWSNVELRATGSAASTWVRSDSGSVAQIIVRWDTSSPDPLAPCNFIGGPGLEWDRGSDELPTWCVRSGNQWERADGTAVYIFDGSNTVWITAFGGYDAERVGGSSAANAEDIAALLPSLQSMSREDVERYLLPTFDGIGSPEVRTPGL